MTHCNTKNMKSNRKNKKMWCRHIKIIPLCHFKKKLKKKHTITMISFESDYNNGTVPQIIERLAEANNQKTSGYGFDAFTEEAKTKI